MALFMRAPRIGVEIARRGMPFGSRGFSLPAHTVVMMPALSPTMQQGTVSTWIAKVGDEIGPGDLFCEIETDKATVDFECQDDGFIAKILVDAGVESPVGAAVAVMVEEKEDIAAFADYVHVAAAAPASAPAAPPAVAPAPAAAAPAATASPPPAASSGTRVFASPLARKIAREKGIDVALVTGTGPRGRIIKSDVDSYVPTAAAPATQGTGVVPGDWREFTDMKPSTIRKIVASRLLESKLTVPHFYLSIDCQMDALMTTRAQINAAGGDAYKISVNDFVTKASALALRDVPEVNASWLGDVIRQYHSVDINMAVQTDLGLFIPLIQNVDSLGLEGISSSIKSLAGLAKENKLTPQDMAVGSFTISNLGMFGIKNFCAVINPPQAAILAVGGTEKRVVPDENGDFEVVQMMNVTLSCDHRVVDGAVGAKWLNAFKGYMENPLTMLL